MHHSLVHSGEIKTFCLLQLQGNVLLETKSQQQQITLAVGDGSFWQRALESQGCWSAAQ